MSVYKRGGCNKKSPNGTCSKCGKKRGSCGVYWFKFMWKGELIRKSTGQGNDVVARNQEAAERTRLTKNREDKEEKAGQLGCHVSKIIACAECNKLFNGEAAVLSEAGQKMCSRECLDLWERRKNPVPTLGAFIKSQFLPWAEVTFSRKPKTWLWYRNGVRRLLDSPALADSSLDKIAGEQIAGYVPRRQSDGLLVSSINRELQVLRRALRLAVEWGVVEHTAKVRLIRGENHREFVLTPEEEARYLAAAPSLLASMATVLADTGLRPEECYRMRWDGITWVNGRNGTLLVTHGKTEAARRAIPMTLRVRTILETRWEAAGRPLEG